MSKPYSKYLVAVVVDQTIIDIESTPPAILCSSVNTDIKASKIKGTSEYPSILVVL